MGLASGSPGIELAFCASGTTTDQQVGYPVTMYTADVLRNVVALRSEIASLRDMNDRYAAQEDPAPVASRANAGRRTRLQEIVRELAAIAKDQRP